MKKRILLIGNDKFMREAYKDGKYFVMPKKKYVKALYDAYDVDNISNFSLTSSRAVSLVNCFVNNLNYDICLISFGNNEIEHVSVEMFEKNLQTIINVLIYKGVFPIIMEIPNISGYDVTPYNKVINNIKVRNDFNNKYVSECLKLVNA